MCFVIEHIVRNEDCGNEKIMYDECGLKRCHTFRRGESMTFTRDKLLVHFDTNIVSIFSTEEGIIKKIFEENVNFEKGFFSNEKYKQIDEILYSLKRYTDVIDNENIRLYATGMFQGLEQVGTMGLINHVYIYHGLYFNIIQPDLEQFYLEKSMLLYGHENVIEGLIHQEFRNVVVCGSFKHSIKEIDDIITALHKQNVNVLSPTTTKLKPETLGSNFVLFEGQELINERDGWRHQYKHISQFAKSDAIIVCNPNGVVGKGALFELGYLVAISKRIIFVEKPQNLSFFFPYEVGLNF